MNKIFCDISDDVNEIEITGTDCKHLQVIRIQPGDKICVCNGRGFVYDGQVVSVTRDKILVSLGSPRPGVMEPSVNCFLYQALCKGEKNDYIVQKAVELGVKEIIFFRSEYSIGDISSKISLKVGRWNKIAKSAAEQSGRDIIPVVKYYNNFCDVILSSKNTDNKLLFYEKENFRLSQYLRQSSLAMNMSVIIGSEGGFSDKEVHIAKDNKFSILSLGKRILRAETASVAALSILMAYCGEI